MSSLDAESNAIETVLRSYRRLLPTIREHRAAEHPGFSGALVRRIETDAESFCLRGWPQSIDDGERILGLHELLRHVATRGIAYVAVPLRRDEGGTLVRAAGRFWHLEPWLPGCADFWISPSQPRLAAAFVALGRFHLASRSFQPPSGKFLHLHPAPPSIAQTVLDRAQLMERFTPNRLAVLRQRLGGRSPVANRIMAAFEHCAPSVAAELRSAVRTPVPLLPCLRDVWHDHVLFQGDKVTGLIDPSAARTDTVTADIARLAGSLIGDDRAAWDFALDAYRSVVPLSDAEARLVGVLDRSGVLLSGMTWLERDEFWQAQPSESQDRIVNRVERIAQRAEQLARSIQ
jgi:Ser/Thr protein kinase RdoA (MazF antagonist)